ncbi:UDP-N-acetylmuramoyl-L-alanyl-D-glutamate--2,6-diaminopimelate ligase [Nodularia spumigena CS-584]|jgi:UDP-N-acetylmuramoyl-L-alanyl-D-glutamate--2,6-diaminopimelate ligase|uniref:UDP-N-acetylmuramoyl-L-alanyl-D-glutamate--2, 6-diaminopimelate ligase n=1 Tax=Nodularia spumigena TaxID=70799 RepID=UPI0000EAB5AA|nr:UDP-N-acetylmuramoyl-L-alanyl-D-glutamate--2,6-diaminopimelate ligase [Nodularia spumigena]AHJ29065.1 UDP-N-acetylmuramoylalanyl-D-glutamate--2,6- diaminopimelate ligase [Nodularia spumigena CCY9414]EAW44317.1 UDP-N-acetylmuramoylalanyl-D-glutamate--2,6-diaminopimelate ligase [Nodularia spumigena CCY9414]MDB9384772.1 UDP-N-acetylmuramoyl-L-alanyl-D-glutamate--2,6-diaminopimelate ligase [Nodularia spumigena CS-584]MEA5527337.1 UDP-N-acetylmuramoyl-L-alanyl-D-glutamate--2,6-diaminopimelate lig
MKLRELLAAVDGVDYQGLADAEIKGLKTNSHACGVGDLFIGMPGTRVDGGDFWQSAIASGALAAIVSPAALQKNPPTGEAVVLSAADMTQACAQLAAAFYGYPGQKLKLVGVTGTNGKTTTTHLIEFLLTKANLSTALMGTLYTRWPGFEQTAVHTTPFAVDLQQQLAEAVNAGCEFGAMEVSSHALAQGRVLGCEFEVAVFSNLTQDHLDYHTDMEDYFAAKALLFSPEYLKGRAIINADDDYGQRLIASLSSERVWSYSVNNHSADLWMSDLSYEPNGVSGMLHTPKGNVAFRSPLVGQYNLENLLAAVGAVLHLGLDLQLVAAAIPEFPGVPGRMERVQINPEQEISVIVDYAHTPDSLENLLKAARPFIPGKMICVFGCGGDRDRTKRPKMGKIAAELADVAVLTSDNPRTEDPERILQDVLAGIPDTVKPTVICDRAIAIRTAILQAQPGDGVLLAGKGHEDYQILGTEKIHFDDREHARDALQKKLNVQT